MKFIACASKCTRTGTHCTGCGRSLDEIFEIKKLVNNAVQFALRMGYDNPEDFITAYTKSLRKKLVPNRVRT